VSAVLYYKLKIDEKKTLKGKTSLEKALRLVAQNPRYMFLLCTETHAMASAYLVNSALTKHEYLLFDPNIGLLCWDTANGFVSGAKNLLERIYKPKSIGLFSMVKE
jgi:hypothetical protein